MEGGDPRPAALPAASLPVAADPIQWPGARAVSIAHTETPSEIVGDSEVGPPGGDNDDPVPATTAG